MTRSWTCLAGTHLPQGWGLTSCHLQLINSFKHPMLIPVPVTDSAAFCSGTAVCSKGDWNTLENRSGWRTTKTIHEYIILIPSPHCRMNDATAFASMQECRAAGRLCPFLQLASSVIANVLEGCKIIRSVDQACKKLRECCLQAIEINHTTHPVTTAATDSSVAKSCQVAQELSLMLFWWLTQQH